MNNRYLVSRDRFIPAAPEAIFGVLATPALHSVIDGSGTVRGAQPRGPRRLDLGARFGMEMNMKVDYKILNTVRGKFFLRLAGYLRRHPASIEKTLLRLEQHVTGAAGLSR